MKPSRAFTSLRIGAAMLACSAGSSSESKKSTACSIVRFTTWSMLSHAASPPVLLLTKLFGSAKRVPCTLSGFTSRKTCSDSSRRRAPWQVSQPASER